MSDNAIWSRRFAQQVAEILGFPASKETANEAEAKLREEGSALIEEITEAFRFLPMQQWTAVENLTRFLREGEGDRASSPRVDRAVAQLREVRDYAQFLRARYGYPKPADESDEWTEEDERDFALAAWRRLDEEDPDSGVEETDAPAR